MLFYVLLYAGGFIFRSQGPLRKVCHGTGGASLRERAGALVEFIDVLSTCARRVRVFVYWWSA